MNDDFDINSVHRLVDEVVGGLFNEQTPQLHLKDNEEHKFPVNKIPFAIYDTDLLSELYPLLQKASVHNADIQMVFDQLRDRLSQNVDIGSLKNIHSLTLNCKRCPELNNANLPIGNLVDPDVIFVMDYPVSDWPTELLALLKDTDISPSRAMLTFITRCSASRMRNPETTEIKNCSTYLYSEIQLLSPKLVITLGSVSSSLFIDPLKISEEHGIIFWSGPWAIMPVYSLAYITRKENADKDLIVDLTKAKNFLYG